MNIKLYNAALTQLRGKAMESLALIDMYLNDPTMVPDHSSLVEEIIKHSCCLSEYESAFSSLQQYFQPKPDKPPASAPTSRPAQAASPPVVEEELYERSSDFRNSPPGKAMTKAKQRKKPPKPKPASKS